jgi:hypothetical protein
MTTPFPFTSGQVLTAAQMNAITELVINDKTASHTLTAADAGDYVIMNSASATTITVNTGIFTTGQIVYIVNKGTASTVVTAGAGVTISTSGSLTVPANGSGRLLALSASAFNYQAGGITATAAGLTLISATSIGSGVSSVTVSSAFSSTYDNYKITVSGGANSVAQGLSLSLGSTTTGYYGAQSYVNYSTGVTATDGRFNQSSFITIGAANTRYLHMNIDLFSPFLSDETVYVGWYIPEHAGGYSVGFLDNTTSYTAFTIAPGAGTLTGGTIRVYGYANS